MKRYIPTIILLFLCLTRCKNDKQNTPPPSGKTYKIVFNGSNSSQSISSTGSKVVNSLKTNAVGPVSSSAKRFYYIVYNSSGKLVHEVEQDSTMSDFGTITDGLPAGTYACYFGAGQHYFYPEIYLSAFLNYRKGELDTWEDWFYKKITLTVTDSNINQDIILERMVGQLQLNIEDTIPASVSNITITTIGEMRNYDYLQGAYTYPQDREVSVIVPSLNFKRTLLIGNTLTPITVKITCYDSKKNVVAQRTISNVQFTKNVKTILSGKLFTASKGDFAVGVNNTFDPTPLVTVKF
ncbi:MAG: hypothetical protein JWR38_3272 [Mucilaginibacter sp.]|nr:hypothetical protein [Mucilaginibacter sp.]